jgi:hypothetical protein
MGRFESEQCWAMPRLGRSDLFLTFDKVAVSHSPGACVHDIAFPSEAQEDFWLIVVFPTAFIHPIVKIGHHLNLPPSPSSCPL